MSACSTQSWIIAKQAASLQPSGPVCDQAISNAYGGGEGSTQDPFRICSLAQWNYLSSRSTDWNKNFKLEADVDFSGVNPSTFFSVGNSTTGFTGTFDGNSFALKNLNLVGGTTKLAFFDTTDAGAVIKNLKLNSIQIESNFRASGLISDHSLGVLILENIEMNNVTIDTSTSINSGIGSLVGLSSDTINLKNLIAQHIWVKLGDSFDSGGFIGGSNTIEVDGAIIDDLKVTSGGGSSQSMGGFIGRTSNPIMPTSSTFKNIKITNLDADLTWQCAGVLSQAYGDTTFDRVTIQGRITASGGQSGLLGQATNWTFNKPAITVIESSFTGLMPNAGNAMYGGLIGTNSGNVTILRSFHSGPLSVWSGTVGGLIGQLNYSAGQIVRIEDSYHAGDITLTHATQGIAGHLIGRITGPSTATIEVRRSFASGGFLGTAGSSRNCVMDVAPNVTMPTYTFEDVKYNSTVCTFAPDANTALGGGIAALNTASLQTATPFTNWLSSVWVFANSANPKLIWEP